MLVISEFFKRFTKAKILDLYSNCKIIYLHIEGRFEKRWVNFYKELTNKVVIIPLSFFVN